MLWLSRRSCTHKVTRDGIPLQSGGTDGMELLYICRSWSEGIPLHSGGNVVMALLYMCLAKWQPVKIISRHDASHAKTTACVGR